MIQSNLPALSDLHHEPEVAFKNDQLNLLLNQPPHTTWVKDHPMVKTKDDNNRNVAAKYLPIDKVEFLMTRIFQKWKVEVLSTQVMFNSIAVTVRLHYLNPVSGEWSFHDGVGAKSVQKDANTPALTIDTIKDAAVMMALPAAKSYAIKDAAEHLGAIFGRDLNRRDKVMFTGSYNEPENTEVAAPAPTAPPPPAPVWNGYEWVSTPVAKPTNDLVL